MFRKIKFMLLFILLLLTGCNIRFIGNSTVSDQSSLSVGNDTSTTISSNKINSNNSSSEEVSSSVVINNSSTIVAPTIVSTIHIHNLDKEYNVKIIGDIFSLEDLPNFNLEDRDILGWYFDELFLDKIEYGVNYAIDENLDIYAKVEFNSNYYIKDFLIDSVSKIYINTENNKVVNTKDTYTNATFEIVDDKEPAYNFSRTNIRMKCRGNSSFVNAHLQGQPFENSKFSYKIKFDEKQNLFNFGKDKEWNLVANFMDRSFIRNHLVYSLSNLMNGLEFTIDHHYVELYINNDYKGLYLLTESVKTGSNRVDIETDYTSSDVEVPFMLEQDQKALEDGSIEGVNYFWSHKGLPFSTKYPDDFTTANVTSAQYKMIRNRLNELYDNVPNNNYADFLDVNSFIDYFMVQEIFRNVDVNHSSVYLYKRVGEVFKMGPIWDFDLSIGNYDYIPSQPELFLKNIVGGGGNYLYNTLMGHKSFKDKYIERFNFVKDTYLKALRNALPSIKQILKPYAEKDYSKWHTLRNNVDCLANNPDLVNISTFEGHVDYIENYLFNGIHNYTGRIPWLSTYLKQY